MDKKTLFSAVVSVMIFAFGSSPAIAQDNENVAELRKQIETLQNRIDQLEAEKRNPMGGSIANPSGNWDPFDEITRMQQEMNGMFQNSFGRSVGQQGGFSNSMTFDPNIDLKEVANGYELKFNMAGLDKEKVEAQINEHSITIKGEESQQNKVNGPDRYVSSQSFGTFIKTIPLPADADTANVKTVKEGDMLIVHLPKKNK